MGHNQKIRVRTELPPITQAAVIITPTNWYQQGKMCRYTHRVAALYFILLALPLLITPSRSLSMSARPPSPRSASTAKLRSVLAEHPTPTASQEPAIIVPGVHDALSAKIFASHQNTQCLFLSGFGVSATLLGEPDAGILTLSEMEDVARRVIGTVNKVVATKTRLSGADLLDTAIPVIVDGDTGYGGANNIRRTIRGLAAAGAAAITIEDQMFPKRCTIAAGAGVRVVSRDQCVERIKCALAARDEAREIDGNDVLIVARTDCRAALGFEEAIARCKAFEALGADIVYAENLQNQFEYEHLRASLKEVTPMMLAQVQQGPVGSEFDNSASLFTAQDIGDMGYALALFGVSGLQSYVQAVQNTADGMLQPPLSGGGVLGEDNSKVLCSFPALKFAVGFDDVDEFESKHNAEC